MESIKINLKDPVPAWIMGLIYMVIFVYLIIRPIKADPNIILAIIIIPFCIRIQKDNYSSRYLFISVLFFIMGLFIPVNSLVIILLLFSIMFLIESNYGKLDELILGLFFFISPVFKNLSHLFEYSLRLSLTEWVAKLFRMLGFIVISKGNMLNLSGKEFSVDPACAGLNMLETSFLLSLFLLGFYQKQTGKKWAFLGNFGIIISSLFLNILSNLIRIIILVIFNIPPNNPAHEFIGIICLFIYGVLPMNFLIQYGITRWAKPYIYQNSSKKTHPLIFSGGLLVGILLLIHIRKAPDFYLPIVPPSLQISGFKKSEISQGLVKFKNPEALIYLKSTNFYSPDHDPMICWRGSGYSFQTIEKLNYKGNLIFYGVLKKGNDLLYSAWWFDNGKMKTTNQWDWRYQAATKNIPFYLINITAQNPIILKKNLEIIFKARLI